MSKGRLPNHSMKQKDVLMWFSKLPEEVLRELSVNPLTGLSTEEAQDRLEKYGKNKLKGKPKKTIFQLFFAQLQDMLIYVLLGAAVVTVVVGEWVDAIIILMVVY